VCEHEWTMCPSLALRPSFTKRANLEGAGRTPASRRQRLLNLNFVIPFCVGTIHFEREIKRAPV
jgi:hypothetical protein